MNVKDAFYHGLRDQVRRVLSVMSDEEIEAGLTAFDTGASNWSSCFFARALPDLCLTMSFNPTVDIQRRLGLESPVPVRIVWNLFDGCDFMGQMTKEKLREFVHNIRENRRPEEVLALLRSLDTNNIEAEVTTSCQ